MYNFSGFDVLPSDSSTPKIGKKKSFERPAEKTLTCTDDDSSKLSSKSLFLIFMIYEIMCNFLIYFREMTKAV